MTIGMSVNVPTNQKAKETIQRLIIALETASSFAREADLWFEGREAHVIFAQLQKQLQRFLKDS